MVCAPVRTIISELKSMVCAPVRTIISELKLGDYLSVQAHKPGSSSHIFVGIQIIKRNACAMKLKLFKPKYLE